MNREEFENSIKKIKNRNFIEKIKDGYVKIKFNSDNNKILMTTIPYEKGRSVKINGKWEKIKNNGSIYRNQTCKGRKCY